MKTLLSLLTILSLMFISCSASAVESDEDNKIADRPITPKEMQRMMGRGFDVQWAEFSKKIELYGEDEVKAIKQKGFNTARIRTKLPADETLFKVLDALKWPEILGCIAGDDTIMCAAKTADMALGAAEKLRSFVRLNK